MIANFFMAAFEHLRLERVPLLTSHFYRYVDDTFLIWHHERGKLGDSLNFMNVLHPNITFTIKIESQDCLPFLDVLVYHRRDSCSGHKVYRKPTRTDLYLHASRSSNRRSTVGTVVGPSNWKGAPVLHTRDGSAR